MQMEEKESTVAKGKAYENLVAEYLLARGYQIRERNFRCRFGEIDLIAQYETSLFFIEVKGQSRKQQAEMKINLAKKTKIERSSIEYIRQHQLWDLSIHYDVAIVTGEQITYYQNAFEGKGDWL